METKLKSVLPSIVSNLSDWFEVSLEIRLFGVKVFAFTWPPKKDSSKTQID